MSVNNREAISHIEALLGSGLKSQAVDGETSQYADRRALLAELQRLKREDTVNGYGKRPRVRTIRLGGF